MLSKLFLDKEKYQDNMNVKFTRNLKKSDLFDDKGKKQRELLSIHHEGHQQPMGHTNSSKSSESSLRYHPDEECTSERLSVGSEFSLLIESG